MAIVFALLGMGLCSLFGVWAVDVGGDVRPFVVLLFVFGLIGWADRNG